MNLIEQAHAEFEKGMTNAARAHDEGAASPAVTKALLYARDQMNCGAQDCSRICMSEDYEVRYWTESLGVSKEQLGAAVAAVGNSADKVKEHLRDNRK